MKLNKQLNDERVEIELLIDQKINYINTNLLCSIVSISENSPVVRVQPLSKRSYIDESGTVQFIDYQTINVKLAYAKGFKSQLSAGDKGLLLICQNNIDHYINNTDYDQRKFDILDGVFLPFALDSQNTEQVKIQTESFLQISNSSYELMAILKEFAEKAAALTVNLSTGDLNPTSITDFNLIATKINSFIKP